MSSLRKTVYLSVQPETRVCRVPTNMNKGRALSCTQPWQVRNETGFYASEGTACSLVDRGHRTILTCLNGRWNKRPSKAVSGQFVLRAVPHVILTANVAWLMTYIPHCLLFHPHCLFFHLHCLLFHWQRRFYRYLIYSK